MINERQFISKNSVLVIAGTLDNKSVASNTTKLIEILSTFTSSIILFTICKDFKSQNPVVGEIRLLFSYEKFLFGYLFNQLLIVSGILEHRRKGPLDFVFFAFNHDLDILPIVLCKILRIPVIIRTDGRNSLFIKYYSNRKRPGSYYFYKILEEVNYRLANVLLTESEYMIKFYKLGKYDHVAVGNLFVDLERFQITNPYLSRKFTLGFVGRFSEEKGVLEFVQALLVLLRSFEFKAVIVGEGELTKSIKKMLRENPMESKNIELRSWVDNEQLPDLLNSIKILVIPSKKEGLPNILLEGMACGTIILGAPVGGIPGVIVNGKTGFLLKNGTSECIVTSIKEILNSEDNDIIIKMANKLVYDKFSFRSSISNLERELLKFYSFNQGIKKSNN